MELIFNPSSGRTLNQLADLLEVSPQFQAYLAENQPRYEESPRDAQTLEARYPNIDFSKPFGPGAVPQIQGPIAAVTPLNRPDPMQDPEGAKQFALAEAQKLVGKGSPYEVAALAQALAPKYITRSNELGSASVYSPELTQASRANAYALLEKRQQGQEKQAMTNALNYQKLVKGAMDLNPEEQAFQRALGQQRAENAMWESLPQAMRSAEMAKRMGIRLKPGEQYNMEAGQVELVPGSEAWRKQQGEVAQTKKEFGAFGKQMQGILSRVNELEQKGYNAATGWWDAMTPVWVSLGPSKKADARSRIQNLQEYLQTRGLADLRASGVAPGSITEREWSKFAAMVGNIDPTLSDEEFGKQLANLRNYGNAAISEMAGQEAEAAKRFGAAWGQAPATPSVPTSPRPVASEAEALQLPPGTRFQLPDGRTGTAR